MSFVALHENALNFATAGINTPVRSNRLWNCLEGYPSRMPICSGFRDGFRIGITQPFNRGPVNKQQKYINLNELAKKLNTELENGRILGPYKDMPVDNLIVSPLYVVPKSTPGKFRLIHDLSHPKTNSVNLHIDDSEKSVQYCSLVDVARYLVLMKRDQSWWMSKVDLKDAYRCVPIHRDDWRYLGMKFQDKYFCDTCLPMGLGTSCRIFTEVSNALAWIFKQQNPRAAIFNYLDDFLIMAADKEQCQSALDSFLATLEYNGFPFSHEKTVLPCQSIEFLGLGVNSQSMSYFIPDAKRVKAVDMITTFLEKNRQSVLTIQKLVGKLTFLCQVCFQEKHY